MVRMVSGDRPGVPRLNCLSRVVSLILCHDRPKGRARQIEKFIDIANRLRNLHNYSGLRAIIAGINSATFEGDESLELLRTKSSEHWKNFQQWDQLLQSVRSHQKYRMALRNTKGACIPALLVLVRFLAFLE